MGPIAKGTIVPLLCALMLAPASAAPPCAPGAVCAVSKLELPSNAHDRASRLAATPIVSYPGDGVETVHADDTIGGFRDVEEYAAFEPARLVRPPAPRLSLLARMRRAASRILSATASLPHF